MTPSTNGNDEKKKNEKEDGGQSSYGKFFITRFLYVGENDGGARV